MAHKKRTEKTYQHKVDKITNWYNRLLELRKKEPKINPNTKLPAKRKELKPLNYYLEKIKKVTGGDK
jgi:AAA15 family ATPase/GTPase